MLKDLQKTLAELELTSECIVHLFPIPQVVATPISGSHQATNVTGLTSTGDGEIASGSITLGPHNCIILKHPNLG